MIVENIRRTLEVSKAKVKVTIEGCCLIIKEKLDIVGIVISNCKIDCINNYINFSVRCLNYVCRSGILIVLLVGCSRRYHDLPAFSPISLSDYNNRSVGRFKTSYLAEQIDHYYQGTDPGPIGVTTFVDLDDFAKSSSFGRMCSEQLISELTMKGYQVIELRKGEAIKFVQGNGEFMLSREAEAIKTMHTLGAIIVGTYTSSESRVYLNVRLIDPRSALVLSAGSVEMEKTDEIAWLLRRGHIAGQLERIPTMSVSTVSVPLTRYPKEIFSTK
jgi:TolB-like protein